MMADGSLALRVAPAARGGAHFSALGIDPPERRSRVSVEEFRSRHLLPRRPVVLTELAETGPIHRRDTPNVLCSRCRGQRLRVSGRECPLAELLGLRGQSTPENSARYPCRIEIGREFRALLRQLTPCFTQRLPDRQGSLLIPPSLFAYIERPAVLLGRAGGVSSCLRRSVMHLHTWITQLHGDTEFTLYAPGQEAFLYADAEKPWQSRMRNHAAPDRLRYPLFCNAQAQRIVLHAGETLFLPCGWWHGARDIDTTVSVACHQLGADNWKDFSAAAADARRREGKPAAARALGTWLAVVGAGLAVLERFRINRGKRRGRR